MRKAGFLDLCFKPCCSAWQTKHDFKYFISKTQNNDAHADVKLLCCKLNMQVLTECKFNINMYNAMVVSFDWLNRAVNY